MTPTTPRSVLVVAAHPDDETLGCGATIAKHVAAGDRVTVLVLGEGVLSRRTDQGRRDLLDQLRADARAAVEILGAHRLVLKDIPCCRIDTIPLLDVVHMIEEVVAEERPQTIYTHHHGDANIDHAMIAKAMQAVCRPMAQTTIDHVYAFEIPSSSEWNFQDDSRFRPNVFVDVRETIETKIRAMERYHAEVRDFPHPRSRTYLQALAQVRGGQVGFHAAEAFDLVFSRRATP